MGPHRNKTDGHQPGPMHRRRVGSSPVAPSMPKPDTAQDRKSTRLNSSHVAISYAVFCLKKKKRDNKDQPPAAPRRRLLDPALDLPAAGADRLEHATAMQDADRSPLRLPGGQEGPSHERA